MMVLPHGASPDDAPLGVHCMSQHNKHVLWASMTTMPDLGGAETDVASEGAMAALYQPQPTFDWASGFTSKSADTNTSNDTCMCMSCAGELFSHNVKCGTHVRSPAIVAPAVLCPDQPAAMRSARCTGC